MGRRELRFPPAVVPVAVAIGVFVLAGLGLMFTGGPERIVTWWPAGGLALAALLLSPSRRGPVLTIAIVVAVAAAHLIDGASATASLGLGVAAGAEAVLAAVAVRRSGVVSLRLDESGRTLTVVALAIVAAHAVTALLGAAVTASAFGTGFATGWARWFAADGIGVLIVLPAIIAWLPGTPSGPRTARGTVEVAVLTFALGGVVALVFGRRPNFDGLVGLPYLCLPPLMWAAMRFGARGATAASLALAVTVSALTVGGRGPFAVGVDGWGRVLNLQLFLLAAATLALLVAITVDRRRRAERELLRSNNDLEQYAAAVSHDLVVPLRSIEGFVELLERDAADRFDEDARELLGLLGQSAAQLRRQVLGLLELARAGARLNLEVIPSRAVVDGVLRALDDEVRSAQAEIEIGWLPHVVADPGQLGLVFANLVGNALKFHDGRPPHVEVQAHRIERAWCFSVTDRGPGIEPGEAARLFAHGYRGRRADGIAGSGLGLAVARRIVEAHGGRIWATRGPEGGTRFEFLLPAED